MGSGEDDDDGKVGEVCRKEDGWMDGWDCVLVRRVLGSDGFCLATTHLVEKDVL